MSRYLNNDNDSLPPTPEPPSPEFTRTLSHTPVSIHAIEALTIAYKHLFQSPHPTKFQDLDDESTPSFSKLGYSPPKTPFAVLPPNHGPLENQVVVLNGLIPPTPTLRSPPKTPHGILFVKQQKKILRSISKSSDSVQDDSVTDDSELSVESSQTDHTPQQPTPPTKTLSVLGVHSMFTESSTPTYDTKDINSILRTPDTPCLSPTTTLTLNNLTFALHQEQTTQVYNINGLQTPGFSRQAQNSSITPPIPSPTAATELTQTLNFMTLAEFQKSLHEHQEHMEASSEEHTCDSQMATVIPQSLIKRSLANSPPTPSIPSPVQASKFSAPLQQQHNVHLNRISPEEEAPNHRKNAVKQKKIAQPKTPEPETKLIQPTHRYLFFSNKENAQNAPNIGFSSYNYNLGNVNRVLFDKDDTTRIIHLPTNK